MTSVMERNQSEDVASGRRTHDATAIRTGARRPGLPSGRALIGSVLIVTAAAGVLVAHRAATSPPTTRFVVVTRDVPAGTEITADALGSVAIDLPSSLQAVAVADANDVIGAVARHDIAKMDLLRPGDLRDPATTPDAESVVVPVEIETARALAESVHPGSRVHVLATDPDGSGTVVLASDVLVVAVEAGDRDGIGASGTASYRLALPDAEAATAVVDASVRKQLTLVVPEGGADRG